MGYCIEIEEIKFKITKEHVDAVVESLKTYVKTKNRIMWVDTKSVLNSNTIEEIFDEIRYPLIQDENGDYTIEYFCGEKLGDDFELFSSIAKYVEDGSHIEYLGEDGYRWRYVFKDSEVVRERFRK